MERSPQSRHGGSHIRAPTGASIYGVTQLPVDRRLLVVAAGVLLVVLFAARLLLRHDAAAPPPPVAAAPAAAKPATSQLVVHVVGAVRRPGIYRFREGARVADAVARAGGATRRADVEVVNLAATLSDGQQIVVPRRGSGGGAAGTAGAAAAGPVHLNSATLEQLDALPGVGPVTAQKILDYRQEHGAFSSVDDLDAIPGIGPARLEQLRDVAAP